MRIKNESLRFTLPVVIENIFTTSVSMIYSSVTGGISKSALTAVGVVNAAMSMIVALFSVVTTGSAILTARQTGKGDSAAASHTVEQTLFLTPILSLTVMALLFAAMDPVLRLLLPGAGSGLMGEGRKYYIFMLLSLPALILTNASAGVLRAAGDSRTALFGTVLSNLVQIGCAWLCITRLEMGILGAALAPLTCRWVSAVFLTRMVMKSHRGFSVDVRRVLRPDRQTIRHIFTVGLPTSVDQLAVQLGYVSINSMLVSIGETEAGVVNVLNAVLMFTGINQTIGSTVSTTLVGHLTGAGKVSSARRTSMRILLITELVSFGLCVPAVVFNRFFAGLFAKDTVIMTQAADFLWIMFPYCFVAVGCNVCEPSERAGGEVRYAMLCTVLCVWLIRLPLTLLFCKVWNMGVPGVYAANMTSLVIRFALAFFKILSPKWGKREI